MGRWLWVEGNCIQGNRQGEGGGRGDVVVFEGGNQDVSVVQAEPGPGNSVRAGTLNASARGLRPKLEWQGLWVHLCPVTCPE